MALATLADVKLHLGIPTGTTTWDAQLTAWMNAAIAGIKAACIGWDFEQITRTEFYQPDGDILISRWKPIQSITSLYEDAGAAWGQASGAFAADTLLVEGEDYALVKDGSGVNGEVSRSGLVARIGRSWAQCTKPVSIAQTNVNAMMRRVIPALGSVKMVFVSGYTAVPADVTQAVCFEVDAMRSMKGKGGATVQSESLGEYSYSLANVDKASKPFGYFLSPSTGTLLAQYLLGSLVI